MYIVTTKTFSHAIIDMRKIKNWIRKFILNIKLLFLNIFNMPYNTQNQLNIYATTINDNIGDYTNNGEFSLVLITNNQVAVDIVNGNASCIRYYDLVLKFEYIVTYNNGYIKFTVEVINNIVEIEYHTNLYDVNIITPISTYLTNNMDYLKQAILDRFTHIKDYNERSVQQRGC